MTVGDVMTAGAMPPTIVRPQISRGHLERAVRTLAAENVALRAELARARAERRRPPIIAVGSL